MSICRPGLAKLWPAGSRRSSRALPTASRARTAWATTTQRGYAVVAQDTRGRYDSEGMWHMLTDDGRDGVDTADWIVAAALV